MTYINKQHKYCVQFNCLRHNEPGRGASFVFQKTLELYQSCEMTLLSKYVIMLVFRSIRYNSSMGSDNGGSSSSFIYADSH